MMWKRMMWRRRGMNRRTEVNGKDNVEEDGSDGEDIREEQEEDS